MTSRFREVTDGAYALPGVCLICRSSRKNMLDVDVDFDFWGVVYLCRECVIEAARVYEAMPFAEVEQLIDDSKKLISINRSMAHRIKSLEAIIEGYRELGSVVRLNIERIADGESGVVSYPDEKFSQPDLFSDGEYESGSDSGIRETSPTGEGQRSKVSEPASDKRSDDSRSGTEHGISSEQFSL